MHYFPVTLPYFFGLMLFFAFLVFLIEIRILGYAYTRIGIKRRNVFLLLFLSLLGGYINIPVYRLPPEEVLSGSEAFYYGMWYVIPSVTNWPGTLIAVNLGGAVIPLLLSLYLILKNRLYFIGFVGICVMTIFIHMQATPVRGVGIAVPLIIPPLLAAIVAFVLSPKMAPALAYISGTMGTLIGADLLNLDKIQGLGAPVASIGGAGTYDGVFLTGIIAVLLASFLNGGRNKPAMVEE